MDTATYWQVRGTYKDEDTALRIREEMRKAGYETREDAKRNRVTYEMQYTVLFRVKHISTPKKARKSKISNL